MKCIWAITVFVLLLSGLELSRADEPPAFDETAWLKTLGVLQEVQEHRDRGKDEAIVLCCDSVSCHECGEPNRVPAMNSGD